MFNEFAAIKMLREVRFQVATGEIKELFIGAVKNAVVNVEVSL